MSAIVILRVIFAPLLALCGTAVLLAVPVNDAEAQCRHSDLHAAANSACLDASGNLEDIRPDLESIRCLVNNDADINGKDSFGETPLHAVARRSVCIHALELLVDLGANLEATDDRLMDTPLFLTGGTHQHDNRRGAEFLIARGANVNAKNNAGATPLHRAANNYSPGVAEALVLNGANVNEKSIAGNTPLHNAAYQNAVTVAGLLINNGANINSKDNRGNTPLDNARNQNSSEVIALLLSHGGKPGSEVADSGGGGGGSNAGLAIGIGAAALVGIALWAFSGNGDPDAFALHPVAAYEVREDGGESLRYGTRLEYRADAWTMRWGAMTSDDETRWSYGGEWRGDVFAVDADAEVVGEAADFRAGLSAEWGLSGWTVRPSARLRSGLSEGGGLSADAGGGVSAEWSSLGWRVRPSVWAADLREADDATFRLRVERAFGPGR